MFKSLTVSTLAAWEQLSSPKPHALGTLQNFLLLQYPQALGSAVHAAPLVAVLRAMLPEAKIAAAAAGFGAEVLRNHPDLDALIETPSPLVDMAGAVRALKAASPFGGQPCVAMQTTGSERSRIALAALRAGLRTRIGFTVEPKLSAAPLRYDPQLSQIANNLRILELLQGPQAVQQQIEADADLLEPRVYPGAADQNHAAALLREAGVDAARPIAIFITQTSTGQRKGWRPERFHAVAAWLQQSLGFQIVFVGTAAESAAVDELRRALPLRTANLAGRTSVLELAALLGQADVALTLDTGPMHLARAMRLPMVVIAPAWSPVIEWLPVGNPRARILRGPDVQVAGPNYVIDEVSVVAVQEALRSLLDVYPARKFGWRR